MTTLRELIGKLVQSHYTGTTPIIYWTEEKKQIHAFLPMIKVYGLGSPATFHGLGATHRKVMNRITIDIKGRNQDVTDTCRQAVLAILGLHCVDPFTGYDLIEYDDGYQHTEEFSGYYWWTIELKVYQIRKPTGR